MRLSNKGKPRLISMVYEIEHTNDSIELLMMQKFSVNTNSTSSLVRGATKSREIARGKQAVSFCVRLSESGRRKLASEKKMNDNISPEDETALLADGNSDERVDAQQDNLLRLLTPVLTSLNSNMTAVSESLKRIHNVDNHAGDEVESAAKRLRSSPESGVSTEVNNLFTEGQSDQDKLLNTTESQDDVLDDIAQSLDEAERTAAPVSEKLANVANKSWLHKLSDDQLKAKEYHRPVNCGKVVVPKVNEEIWSKLPRPARGKDLKFSRLQTNMTKVGHIAVKSTDLLLKLKAKVDSTFAEEFKELVVMTTDAIALLGHASFELSQIRREDIKPNLHKDYGDLCSANVPVTELLFGDELQTQLTHIRATNKISSTTCSSHPPRRTYYGQNFNQNGKQHNRPFLSRAPPMQSRQNKGKPFYPRTKRADQQQRK